MASFINSTKTTNWILIFLIVGALGLAGWYFWHKKQVEDADAALINHNPETPAE